MSWSIGKMHYYKTLTSKFRHVSSLNIDDNALKLPPHYQRWLKPVPDTERRQHVNFKVQLYFLLKNFFFYYWSSHLWWSMGKKHVSRRQRQNSGTFVPEFWRQRLETCLFPVDHHIYIHLVKLVLLVDSLTQETLLSFLDIPVNGDIGLVPRCCCNISGSKFKFAGNDIRFLRIS